MIEIGFLSPRTGAASPPAALADRKVVGLDHAPMRQCPKCGAAALVRQEGCDTCTSCDYSKCG
jgi:ribonucleoside-diphosphate reductase alpha chain